MKKLLYSFIVLIAILIPLTSCSVFGVYSGEGTIVFIGRDCKIYGLISDAGERFELANLREDYPEFQADSLRVEYRVKDLDEQNPFCNWGTRVEVLSLEKLDE